MLERARGYGGGGWSPGGGRKLKLAFLGTPQFAVPTLERLAERGHSVGAVFTQPDRPRGRGQELGMSPVKEAALRLGIEVFQPARIRREESVDLLRSMAPDAMVVVGYGQILPQAIIDIPPFGILNVHASLLPAYRGAAPIQWAIANGERRTGVTIMRIDAGLDTGDLLLSRETEIGEEETSPELGARLAVTGASLLVEALEGLAGGRLTPQPQDDSQATYAPVLKREDGEIDWRWPAAKIHNRARGFLPWPGAFSTFRGQQFHIWRSRLASERTNGAPGSLHPRQRRLLVSSGDGTTLELLEVQMAGKKRIPVESFLNGHRVVENEQLGGSAE